MTNCTGWPTVEKPPPKNTAYSVGFRERERRTKLKTIRPQRLVVLSLCITPPSNRLGRQVWLVLFLSSYVFPIHSRTLLHFVSTKLKMLLGWWVYLNSQSLGFQCAFSTYLSVFLFWVLVLSFRGLYLYRVHVWNLFAFLRVMI